MKKKPEAGEIATFTTPGGFIRELATSRHLVAWVLEQKAFGSGPKQEVSSNDSFVDAMSDEEKAVFAARELALTEWGQLNTLLSGESTDHEKKAALQSKMNISRAWAFELEELLQTRLELRFAGRIMIEQSIIGVRQGFQVVVSPRISSSQP